MSASIYWLILGVICIALEAFGITGIGLFFAGVGAFVTGVLIETGMVGIESYVAQFAWFFAFTALSAAALWKPMKTWKITRKGANYSNMVGERATVTGEALKRGKEGKVMWSGAPMVAELVSGAASESVAVGETVIIKDIKGNKLFVDLSPPQGGVSP